MRPASGSLIALLNSANVFHAADLLTISFWDSSVLRLASGDINLTIGANTFLTSKDNGAVPMFERGKTRVSVGLEVDTLDIKLLCGSTATLNGISMAKAAINGAFDGAVVKLERVFMPTWGDTSYGSIILFEGSVAGVQPSSTKIQLVVKSELESLNVAMPRNIFTPSCMNHVYDAACGLAKGTFTVSGTATGTPTVTTIPSALAQAADYFTLGTLTMTSGASAGARRAVKAFSGGLLTLAVPLPVAPSAGDTFTVYPGCARSFTGAQGCPKFSNTARFRGTPFIPRPETAR